MKCLPALVLSLVTTAWAHLSSAQPPRRAIELSMQAGYGHVFGKDGERRFELSSSNGGLSAATGLAFRTPYLFVPWIEFGWAQLQSSREAPKSLEFRDESPSDSRLTTSYIVFGPSVEQGVLRFRTGFGWYRQQVDSSFAGHTMEATSWDFGYFLAYGVRAYDGPRYGWGLEANGLLMSEAQLVSLGIALRVWWNVWCEIR